jgi:hypothetical protein
MLLRLFLSFQLMHTFLHFRGLMSPLKMVVYRVSEKDCTLFYFVPFFIFFSRYPVCGEWCKLH